MTVSLKCNVDEGLVDLPQLRERFAGSEEVSGSIPLRSTINARSPSGLRLSKLGRSVRREC